MTLQNRVLPTGEIVATPARGLFMGNRGILHDEHGHLGTARWRHPHWITCRLEFRGRKRALMQPRRYTELFFLDEATSFAAGHRPCAECRRDDYRRFLACWDAVFKAAPKAAELDQILHRDRIDRKRRTQLRHTVLIDDLPEGTFVLWQDRPHLVTRSTLRRYSPAGYTDRRSRPVGCAVEVLTPKSIIKVLQAGYQPMLHPS